MNKQSIIIIILGLAAAAWGGWLTYNSYPLMLDSILMFSQTAEQIGKFKAGIYLFVQVIPVFFLLGGMGLLLLKGWGLRLVHTTIFIDIFINLFRLGRHVYFWFKPLETIEISVLQYFFDPAMMVISMLVLVEIIAINFSTHLKNGLIN
ncbi:MAG: hypothetical protein KJ915_12840 [Candidatus Omnitrophica bacterium]|nr:hypothetical protein [Candidatus Omnitrophota bacterium]